MQNFLIRRWFLIGLLLVILAGFGFHSQLVQPAAWIPRGGIVAAVLFLMALPLELSALWQCLRRPRAALLGVAMNYGLLPPLAWLVAPLLPHELGLGLIVIACIPSTLASAAVWTRRAGGNDAVPVLITIITTLTCFLVTPAWLSVLTTTELEMDFGPLVGRLVQVVILPITLAQLLRLWKPLAMFATRRKIPLGVITQLGVLVMIFVGIVESGEEIARNVHESVRSPGVWLLVIALATGLHLVALVLGHLLGILLRVPRADRIGVGFGGSQKTLMVGLDIGLEYFGGLAILPMVIYHVSQLLVDTAIADQLRNTTDAPPSPSDGEARESPATLSGRGP